MWRTSAPQLKRPPLGSDMPAAVDTIQDVSNTLFLTDTFRSAEHEIRLVFLLPHDLWRPLDATWWKGKQVSLIGGDEGGNYLLRHSDGSIRIWYHAKGADETIAPSVRAFLAGLGPRRG